MAAEMALVSMRHAASGGLRTPRVIATFRRARERLRDAHADAAPLATRQYAAAAESLGIEPAEVERVVDEWMYRRPHRWLRYCRRRALPGLLEWLEGEGVRRGVLSDYPAHDKLEALGVSSRFDLVVCTVDPDVNAFKPDPRGFLAAAARWGLDPAEVLYVGDRVEVDAAGARAAGMPFALLTRRRGVPGGVAIRDLDEVRGIVRPASPVVPR